MKKLDKPICVMCWKTPVISIITFNAQQALLCLDCAKKLKNLGEHTGISIKQELFLDD